MPGFFVCDVLGAIDSLFERVALARTEGGTNSLVDLIIVVAVELSLSY